MVSADKRQVLPLLTVESESVRNKMLANLRAALPDEHIDIIDKFSSQQLNEVDVGIAAVSYTHLTLPTKA